jgi:hypothetical protein
MLLDRPVSGIVENGESRLRAACWRQAKAEVMAQHAERLRACGPIRRFFRRLMLRRAVRMRARALLPVVSSRSSF